MLVRETGKLGKEVHVSGKNLHAIKIGSNCKSMFRWDSQFGFLATFTCTSREASWFINPLVLFCLPLPLSESNYHHSCRFILERKINSSFCALYLYTTALFHPCPKKLLIFLSFIRKMKILCDIYKEKIS